MTRPVHVIAINALVLLGMVYVLNTLSAVALDAQYQLEDLVKGEDSRASLPPYRDRERAALILDEFRALRTQYAPYVAWSRSPFQGETTTVGPKGDRIHPHTTETPKQIVRFFGGSTVWATGVDDRGTIPALFDQKFRDVVAYNHGESGFVSRQSLARLINLVNQGAPMDWVVFYEGYNDVQYRCRGTTPNGHAREARLAKLVSPDSYVLNTLLGSLREVANFLAKPLRRWGGHFRPCQDDPEYVAGIANTLVANWKIAREVARLGGAGFVAILQPMAGIGDPQVDYLDLDDEELSDYSVAYRAIQREMASAAAPWMIDMSSIFDGEPALYIDTCHVVTRGNQLVADAVARELIDTQGASL